MRVDVPTGTVLAGFRVESLIGEGAMGAVYLALEIETGRRVALKVLVPELARDERFRQRFLRESQLAAGLDHPHIVPTLASGEDGDVLFLVMAHVAGADLREVLRREGRLEPGRALALVGQIAGALDAAHEAGLVHRDVKPGNILVAAESDGEYAYLCDFGLAKHASSVSSLTGERAFVGTIDYVPPEQIEGRAIDGRADVYSLGCVLYECLAGARPFERESELAVVFAHLNEAPTPITELRSGLSPAFDGVFETALAKSPDDRYSTCGELVAAAGAALEGRKVERRKPWRRRYLLAAAVILAAAGAAIGGVLASRDTNRPARLATGQQYLRLRPNALNLIDARARRVVGQVASRRAVPLADRRLDIAFTRGSAWVLLGSKQELLRVDLSTRKVVGHLKLPWPPGARIATGGGFVWLMQDVGPKVIGVEARTGRIARRFDVGGLTGQGIAYGNGSLWLAAGPGILRLDPRTGRMLHRITMPIQQLGTRWLRFADGALWVAAGNGLVLKIDPVENRILRSTRLEGFLSDLAVDGGFLWIAKVPDGILYKLSEDDLSDLGSVPSGPDPERISTGAGSLWIANTASKKITLIREDSGTHRQLAAGAEPMTAYYHDGLVWASAAPAPIPLPAISGQELRIAAGGVGTDPATAGLSDEQVFYATCAKLLNYPDTAGAAGRRLRPEIAAAMPSVSRDERTYTFRIRPGFRFSPPANEPVTAETFRHSIERVLAPKRVFGPAWPLLPDIDGMSAYRAGKAAHVSGIAAHGNTLSITLVRPAGDFLTRLSMDTFCPVPLGEPLPPPSGPGHPIPSAGPYYISSLESNRVVLERNPNYQGNRPRRSARIVYTLELKSPEEVALIDRGELDYLPPDWDNNSLLVPAGVLEQRYGPSSAAARAGRQRYFPYSIPAVDVVAFNTNRPLFRDRRLRRAVGYALDRPALAHAYFDTPSDQLLPPSVPGHRARNVFPLDKPDLATARRLTGERRTKAVLYSCNFDPSERRVAEIVRTDLARIGIDVSILQSKACFHGADPALGRADLFLNSFLLGPANRDPIAFLEMALGGVYGWQKLGPGPWKAPAFRRRVEAARALRGPHRAAVYARLAEELMRQAPFVVYGNFVRGEYLSPKVGCRIPQGEYGFSDLGALCKR